MECLSSVLICGSRARLRANSNLGPLKFLTETQVALSQKMIGCIMICAPARNSSPCSLRVQPLGEFRLPQSFTLCLSVVVKRTPSRGLFLTVGISRANDCSYSRVRDVLSLSLSRHPDAILAPRTCGRSSSTRQLCARDSPAFSQPSQMSWAMSARVVSSQHHTRFSFVDSGIAIRITMSMTSYVIPAPPRSLCTVHHFGVNPTSPTVSVRTSQEAQR